MAFSVVSTIDGSMLGSLSASKRRSLGSNRAVERKASINKIANKLCINTVFQFYLPTVVQQKGKVPSSYSYYFQHSEVCAEESHKKQDDCTSPPHHLIHRAHTHDASD